MRRILITGGAGFIGSHLCRCSVKRGDYVVCVDNLILGTKEQLREIWEEKNFVFYERDVGVVENMVEILQKEKIEQVYHLAANSDIQKGTKNPKIDLKHTFATTYSVLEAMRQTEIRKLFFASTSAVYGEKMGQMIKEDAGNLAPISYYGGAKLASEAFLSAYTAMNDMEVLVFRFPNIIGGQLTHGVIYDFLRKLLKNPKRLEILGDGTQCKPYLYISDLIEAILQRMESMEKGVQLYNVGVETSTTVKEIADMVCRKLNLNEVKYCYTEGNRGWKGDVPSFQYDLTKIQATGWKAKYTSNEAVWETLKQQESIEIKKG